MATSRGATPADPVLAATTDDNSRGGLFVRSNIANPVSGADVTGTTINNSEITLQLNGELVGTFTLNQDTPETFNFVVDTSSGGGNTPVGDGTRVAGGRLVGNDLILFTNNSPPVDLPPIDISGINTNTQRTDAEINRLADDRITAANLVRTVNNVSPDNTGNVAITGGNTFGDTPTVNFTTDSVTSEVTAQSFSPWTGNGGAGGNVTGAQTVNASRVVLAENTGLVLSNAGGIITIQRANTAAERPAAQASDESSALDAPAPEDRRVVYTPQGTDTIMSFTNTRVTRTYTPPGGTEMTTTITGATETIDPSGLTATITIPQTDASPPGDYRVRTTVTTRTTEGETMEYPEDNTIMRVIPYYQSRVDLTNEASFSASGTEESMLAFDPSGGFTSIAGNTPLYLAADSRSLPSNFQFVTPGGSPFGLQIAHLRTISNIRLADGTMIDYNVFSVPVSGATRLENFRMTFL